MSDKNNDLSSTVSATKPVELPQGLRQLADGIITAMKRNVEEYSMLLPTTVYLENTKDKQTTICGLDLTENPRDRESIFSQVRNVAQKMDADVSVSVLESYMRTIPNTESVDKVYAENGGSLENDPKSIEVVIVSIETPTQTFMGISKIQPDDKTKSGRKALDPEFRNVRLEGRMANVIIKQAVH